MCTYPIISTLIFYPCHPYLHLLLNANSFSTLALKCFVLQRLYFLCVTLLGHYLSQGSACLNHSKSRSINAFEQLRQIHFYVASLLPGTTICSHCTFCLLSRLLQLLLEMTRPKTSQVVCNKVTSRFQGNESSWAKSTLFTALIS